MRLRHLATFVAAVVILGGVGVLVYRSIIPGLSSARREPPAAECRSRLGCCTKACLRMRGLR